MPLSTVANTSDAEAPWALALALIEIAPPLVIVFDALPSPVAVADWKMPSSTLALAFAAAAVPFELASALIVIEPLLVMVLLAPPVPANALSLMPSMTEAVALPLVALALAP